MSDTSTTQAELQHEVEAQRKTIEALMNVAERRQANVGESDSSFRSFQHAIALQRAVEKKTAALEETVRELGETQGQLLHAHKLEAVGQLAAGVAHEINTPMQYIGDNARFLEKAFSRLMPVMLQLTDALGEDGDLDTAALQDLGPALRKAKLRFLSERIPRAITQSVEGVEAVSRIVSAMKEFSHPGTEEKQATDLNRLLETTTIVSRNEWKYVAELRLELAPDVPAVLAHGDELGQVFLNLIVNAAHAIEEANAQAENPLGTICVRSRCVDPGWVEVEVVDSGPGIPDAIQERIFEPFFTTKTVGRGTGQGLAIARSIVFDKHQGHRTIASSGPEGTVMRVTLPVAEQGPQA